MPAYEYPLVQSWDEPLVHLYNQADQTYQLFFIENFVNYVLIKI